MTDFQIELWRQRADGGDSRYAIALGLIEIAEAIKEFGTNESTLVSRLIDAEKHPSVDERFDELIRMIEGTNDEPPPPDPKRSWFWWRNR